MSDAFNNVAFSIRLDESSYFFHDEVNKTKLLHQLDCTFISYNSVELISYRKIKIYHISIILKNIMGKFCILYFIKRTAYLILL